MKDIVPKKWWALGAIAFAMVAFGLDLTVLNLALPTLSRVLHASTNQLQWIVDGYSLALAVMLLPAGLLGDRFGRKKLLLIALAVFGVASLACAYSHSTTELITARIVLGASGAFIAPLAISTVPVYFAEDERPKAVGVLLGANFAAFPLGPILGGWMLTKFWWGSVFLINLPIVALALVAIGSLLPESRSLRKPRIDVGGLALSIAGLTGITYGAIQAETKGWGDMAVIAMIAAGVALTALFAWLEYRKERAKEESLIDLKLFASRGFTWGTILVTLVSFAMFGLLFTIPQYFQSVGGKSALGAGLRLLPMIIGLVLGTGIGARIAKKVGAKVVVAIGFVVTGLGLALGATTGLHSSDSFAITWIGIMGVGLGLTMPTSLNAALAALTPERSGVGSSLLQAMRQVGSTLGVAILGTVLGASYRRALDVPATLPATAKAAVRSGVTGGATVAHKIGSNDLLQNVYNAFVHGMDSLLWVCVGITVVGFVLTLLFLPNKKLSRAKAPSA